MEQNYLNNGMYQNQPCAYPAQSPNAVNINIYTPQAFSNPNATQPVNNPDFYSMYGQNSKPNLPLYPQNYNNMINQTPQVPQAPQTQSTMKETTGTELYTKKGSTEETEETKETKKEDKKEKTIVPLTDDYIKSLENYLNNDNPKIRLIAGKEILERFKEDETRKDNPSLIPLLNKMLKDASPSVRFIALTALQLGYSVGNDETVALLKQIQAQNQDKIGEDSLLASEILLKMSAPQAQVVKEN